MRTCFESLRDRSSGTIGWLPVGSRTFGTVAGMGPNAAEVVEVLRYFVREGVRRRELQAG